MLCCVSTRDSADGSKVHSVHQSTLPQNPCMFLAVSYGMLEDWKDEMTGVEVSDGGNAEDAK